MKKRTYGVLIHGAGWVSSQHAAAFKNNPYARIVAVSSRSLGSAQRRVAESGLDGAICYGNFETALRHPEVDIVVVCTPQHAHCANVLAAAKAGKHIVIEKPAGISLAELRAMRAAVKRAGVKTLVSFVLRWNPLFQELKSMSARGDFGNIYSVEADYLSHNGSWWSGWADTRTLRNGVSAMLVAGCHAIDAVRWFAARKRFEAANPVEVFAYRGGYRKGARTEYDPFNHTWGKSNAPMEYDGLEIALLKFDNGVLGKVSVNFDCIMPYRFPLRIFGDRGTVFDNRVWSHRVQRQKKWYELSAIQPDSSDVAHHPFQAEIDHFIDCLHQGQDSHCDLADASKTHEVVFAALESYRTGKPVRLPLKQANQ